MLCAGVCETDLQLIKGYMGFRGVLGHEFVGVAESGPHAGRRVVGEINCACWTCETCRCGLPTHCPNRTVLGILNHDGAFADLHRGPAAEPAPGTRLAAGRCRGLHRTGGRGVPDSGAARDPARRTASIVLGDGRLGNLCAQVLARLSDHVLVVGKHPEKLALLAAMGIDDGAARPSRPTSALADIVVDCTGSETGLPTALRLVRPRGTIVLKTTVAGTQTLAWAPFVIDEVTLVGSRCGPVRSGASRRSSRGDVDVRPLVSDRFDLSSGLDALARARRRAC